MASPSRFPRPQRPASSATLPVSARLAWWGTAWLRGRAAPDDVVDAVIGDHTTHVVPGLDGAPSGLLVSLAGLRADGATALGAAFPAEGDPVGLGGPRPLTDAAVDAGEAVVVLGEPGPGCALVPVEVGAALEWHRYRADPRPPADLGEADRALRGTVLEAARVLADLDVARWRPEVADLLHDLGTREPVAAPAGTPSRCVDLAGRALVAREVVALALEDDGGAVSVSQASARREVLTPLARAARRGLTAACSPDGWPPPD